MEIERKFLIEEPPPLDAHDGDEIEQGYLAIDDERRVEVRVRRRGERRVLTVKGGSGRVRTEEEVDLDDERFGSLWALTEGRRLTKRRYVIPQADHEIELDVYSGDLEGLIVAEVEFDDEEAAEAFEAPEWFGRELTGNEEYANQNLARKGRPR